MYESAKTAITDPPNVTNSCKQQVLVHVSTGRPHRLTCSPMKVEYQYGESARRNTSMGSILRKGLVRLCSESKASRLEATAKRWQGVKSD